MPFAWATSQICSIARRKTASGSLCCCSLKSVSCAGSTGMNFERNRAKFIPVDPAQDTLFKEQQQSDPDAVFRRAIEQICEVAQANGIQPVLLELPTADELNTEPSAVSKVKHDNEQRLGVPLVDMTGDLQPQGKALYLAADPVHLNARGNQLIAQRLFETIDRLINP